ncbi:hypothetical protein ACFS32_05400 [Novosphingobium pokkalii]|uniref:hypothetical protein n=1 Tax=Novosphingobium pokkalii TaxID=1770194 RepID=UPI003637E9EE
MIARSRAALGTGSYVMGESFTGADFLISSAMAFGRQAFPADQAFDAYIARCRSRPAAIRALALDGHAGVQTPA